MGAYHPRWYLSTIRKKIFDMKHDSSNTYIKYIGEWHFEKSVYSTLQNHKHELDNSNKHLQNTDEYNKLILNSRYSLCPSGSGPNSIRLWESLACGSIPIILSDTLDLPSHHLWNKAIIRVPEKELHTIPYILKTISHQEENNMRKNCIQIYNHFKNNYKNEKANA